ncbi:MAG: GTP cyclohydrolase I FolE [Acidobacteriota bacterium]
MEDAVRRLLAALGENPDRPGLKKTPTRVAESLLELTRGHREPLEPILEGSVFEDPSEAMVLVKGIPFYSLCEHHLLPFFGKAHVAYVPNGRLMGLSKIPRILDHYARRLQVQERLTEQVADTLTEALKPRGLGVVLEATHLCMVMRGVQKEGSSAATSALRGSFLRDARTRAEFLGLIRSAGGPEDTGWDHRGP